MFKKLLSNLPFNPSLINQVAFYGQRMHQEERVRRSGLILVVLAVLVQMFAVISPPQPTLAESDNDIIRGGFATKEQAVLHCLNGSSDFFEILTYYGLGCDSVNNASVVEIRSNAADYDSLGRNQQGSVIARTGKATNEYPVDIPGAGRFWMKDLRAWDSGAYSTYKVLRMTNKYGQTIMVMFSCGNIVTTGKYTPPEPPPPPPPPANRRPAMNFSANCSAVSWSAGDYDGMPRVRIYITPSTANSETDWANKGPFVHSSAPTGSGTVNAGSWPVPSQYQNQTTRYRVFGVVSDRLPGGQMDDTNFARAIPVTGVLFGPCAELPPPPPPPSTPEPPTDVCPNTAGTQTSTSECDVCPSIGGVQSSEAECKPCEAAEDDDDGSSCLILSKTARNNTQNIENADGTVAAAGDSIIYNLSAVNNGKITVKGFVVEENISDILDYADVTDLNGGVLDGSMVRWPKTDLSPGETVKEKLIVKIKNPIPNTPMSASDPSHFDLVMNNVYGNAVNIKLSEDIVKRTETVATTLPNTGPGEVLAVSITLTVVVSYFFARSRLMGKELDLVRAEYTTSGGL